MLRLPLNHCSIDGKRWNTVFQSLRLWCRKLDFLLCLILCGLTLTSFLLISHIPRGATLTMSSPPFVVPVAGFHDVEEFPDRDGNYRWTKGSSVIELPNPGGVVEVGFVLAGGPDRSVPARFYTQDTAYELIVTPEPRIYTFVVSTTWEERLSITMTSPIFEDQQRRLGIVVGDIQIAGGQAIPGYLVVSMLMTILGVYTLPRQFGIRIYWSFALACLILALLMLWQLSSLWYYTAFVPLLWFVIGMNTVVALFHCLRVQSKVAIPSLMTMRRSQEYLLIGSFSALVAVNVLLFVSVYMFLPILRDFLYDEDQLIESIAAVLLLGVFLMSIKVLCSSELPSLQRGVAGFFAILGLVAFLDEVSYGQRFFGFSTLYMYNKPVDGVHDVFEIVRAMPASDQSLFFLWSAVICLVAITILWVSYQRWSRIVTFVRTHDGRLMSFFLFTALVFMILSTMLDFLEHKPGWISFTEELLELNVGLALLFAVFSLALPRRVS